jgi:hypothetical protein
MDQVALICRNREGHSSCATHPAHFPEPPLFPPIKSKGRLALIWGVVSTVLSGLGFIGFALFEQYNNSLAELRNDLKHFNETSSSFVQKDTFDKHREQFRQHFKEMQAADMVRARLEKELSIVEKERETLARELQLIRERLAFVEGQQTAGPSLQRASSAPKPH